MGLQLTLLNLAGILKGNGAVANPRTPYIYWMDSHNGKILGMPVEGGAVDTVFSCLRDPLAMQLIAQKEKLLVLEWAPEPGVPGQLERADYQRLLDEFTSPLAGNLGGGLAADAQGNFWLTACSAGETGEQRQCILKGSMYSTELKALTTLPPADDDFNDFSLTVSPSGTKLYIASTERAKRKRRMRRIWELNADSSSAPRLVAEVLHKSWIGPLVLDETRNRLLFLQHDDGIYGVQLDGTGLQKLHAINALDDFVALAYDPVKNRIYLGSESSCTALYSVEAAPGARRELLTPPFYGGICGIAIQDNRHGEQYP